MDGKLTLRNLLLLDAGGLKPAEQEFFRSAIKQNANCRRVWQLMSRQSARLEAGQFRFLPRETERSSVAADVVAGYIDGTLQHEQTQRLERRALQDPDLLAELMLHFRGLSAEEGATPLPWVVTERLFTLGDCLKQTRAAAQSELTNPHDTGLQRNPPLPSKLVRATGQTTPKPVLIQMARTVSPVRDQRKPHQKPVRKSNGIPIWAAVITSAATLVGLWFAFVTSTKNGDESQLAQAATRGQPSTAAANGAVAPIVASSGSIPDDRNGRDVEPNPATSGIAGWALVSLEEERDIELSGWQIDPAASVFHQFSGHIVEFKWLALEGVVALRTPGEELWFGPRSTAETANGLEWRTLPGSWANARLGKLGEIVLDSDSTVVVQASAAENMLALDLAGGRLGLKKLPENLQLRIKHDQVTWELAVLEQGTSLGIDWLEGEPRLAVQSGQVRFGNRYLNRNEQLVWHSAKVASQPKGGDAGVVSPLKEQLAWLDRPKQSAVVSGAAQAELLASGNMVAEMKRMGASSTMPEQVLAQHLPAILSPESQLLSVLEGTDVNSRNEALEWLINLPPRSPKTRQIWRSISQKSGVPQLVPEYFRLIQLVRNSAPVIELDAEFLSAGLKHERLFVREMSQALLELRFGNTVQYDAADTDTRHRDKLAEGWTKEILAGYRPAAAPRR
jgi:hypothetical protein